MTHNSTLRAFPQGKLNIGYVGSYTEAFKIARKQHPAVESAINHLEHRGLNRVYSYGSDGFKRTVALAVLCANCCRLGSLVRNKELQRLSKPLVRPKAA